MKNEIRKRARHLTTRIIRVRHEIYAHNFCGFFIGIKALEIPVKIARLPNPLIHILIPALGNNTVPLKLEKISGQTSPVSAKSPREWCASRDRQSPATSPYY